MSQLGIVVIVLLMPGIITTIILDKITEHRKWTNFRFSLYSLVFGMLSYWLFQLSLWIWPVLKWPFVESSEFTRLSIWAFIGDAKAKIEYSDVAWATLLAIPLAFLIALIYEKRLLNRVAGWLRISDKCGDESVFYRLCRYYKPDWVAVRDMGTELVYYGYIDKYDENETHQEILLADVHVYENDALWYETSRVYLCKERGLLQIEIPNNEVEVNG